MALNFFYYHLQLQFWISRNPRMFRANFKKQKF